MLDTMLLFFLSMLFVSSNCQVEQDEEVCALIMSGSGVQVCPDEDSQSLASSDGVRVRRINETMTIMDGELVFKKPLDMDTSVICEVFKMSSTGQWVTAVTYEMCQFCEDMKDTGGKIYDVTKHFGGFPTSCPVEPGVYHIQDMTSKVFDFEMKSSHAGDYMLKMQMYTRLDEECKEKTFLGCFIIHAGIECM